MIDAAQNTAPAAAPVSQNQGLPLSNPAHIPVTTPVADKYVQTMAKNSLLTALMAKTAASQNIQQQPVAQTAAVTPVKTPRLESSFNVSKQSGSNFCNGSKNI